MKEYKGVDIFKLFFAFCVVQIHWEALSGMEYPLVIDWILSLAVPFFFITTGFLLSQKYSLLKRKEISLCLFKRATAVLRLFLIWIMLYLPIDIFCFYKWGNLFTIERWSNFLNHLIFYGEGTYSWPMWYLYSLCVGLFLMGVFSKFRYGLQTLLVILLTGNIIYHYGLIGNLVVNSLLNRALWGGVL